MKQKLFLFSLMKLLLVSVLLITPSLSLEAETDITVDADVSLGSSLAIEDFCAVQYTAATFNRKTITREIAQAW